MISNLNRLKLKKYFSGFIVASLLGAIFIVSSATTSLMPEQKRMNLVWADEFNNEGLPDTAKWSYDLGDGCPKLCGWGNNELQYYMANRKENARVRDGHLIIEAHREKMGTKEYTSSRMVSKHKGDWTYGKIEAKAKLPSGVGTWAAIWMLPTEWAYGDWPASGEIDIMEYVGYMPDSIFGTVHTTMYNGMLGTQQSKGRAYPAVSTEFHTYGIAWDADKIDFLFDDVVYHTFHNHQKGTAAWPFNLDFHLLLNLAVGGNWGGTKGVDTTIWPQQMVLDYIRVYQ